MGILDEHTACLLETDFAEPHAETASHTLFKVGRELLTVDAQAAREGKHIDARVAETAVAAPCRQGLPYLLRTAVLQLDTQSGILLPARCTVGPRPVRRSILATVIDDTVEGSYIVAQPHKTHHEDQ